MLRYRFAFACVPCLTLLLASTAAEAQPLGTFRWQLQPFCNVVVVNITQQGAVYQIDGFDDQCGAPQRAPLVGLATPNPDGTVGFGLSIVTVPGGRSVHVDARMAVPSLAGTWSDSSGNSGTFAFSANTGGSPRPLTGLGAVSVNPAQVQLRVVGACPIGDSIQQVHPSGAVECAQQRVKTGANGVGLDLSNSAGVMATPGASGGAFPPAGPGSRFFYHAVKDALRVGRVAGTQWDTVNIGVGSVATGNDTTASGTNAVATGRFTVASGSEAVAMGIQAVASGNFAVAFGQSTTAAGDSSMALGFGAVTTAAADGSFVFADRSPGGNFTSFIANQFLAKATGGVGFYTNNAATTGVELAPAGSSWASLSDVNAKENFRDVDGESVLGKLAAMSIREWNYKAQDAGIRHMGPTAQEFRSAFGLGDFPLRINTIDADGVALAAIKALETRTRQTNERLQLENDELRARLARLERLLPQ